MFRNCLWKSILAGFVFFMGWVGLAYGEDLTVTVLNVGQADSILIQTADKNVLIDAGEEAGAAP